MKAAWLVPLLFLPLAGCLDNAPGDTFAPPASNAVDGEPVDMPPSQGPDLFQDRPFVSQVTWDVNVNGERHEQTMSFHGVHRVPDEYARPTDALVFQSMIDLRHEGEANVLVEETVALADGRVLGLGYPDIHLHQFMPADIRHTGSLLNHLGNGWIGLWSVDWELGVEIPSYLRTDRYVAYDGAIPAGLSTECRPLERITTWDDAVAALIEEGGEPRTILCFDDHVVPLWAHMEQTGSESYTVVVQRTAGDFPVPQRSGTPHPVESPYAPAPWEPALTDLEGDALLVPPSGGADWSAMIRERTELLAFSPGNMLQMSSMIGDMYTPWVSMNYPSFDIATLVEIPGLLEEMVPGSNSNIIVFGDGGNQDGQGIVESYNMGPEQDPVLRPHPSVGFAVAHPSPWPLTDARPEIVPPASYSFDYLPYVPMTGMISFFVMPEIPELEGTPGWDHYRARWTILEECFDEWDNPWPPRFAMLSAVSGRLETVGLVELEENRCGVSTSQDALRGDASWRWPLDAIQQVRDAPWQAAGLPQMS